MSFHSWNILPRLGLGRVRTKDGGYCQSGPDIVLVLFLGSPELGSIPVINLEYLGLRLYQEKALIGGGAQYQRNKMKKVVAQSTSHCGTPIRPSKYPSPVSAQPILLVLDEHSSHSIQCHYNLWSPGPGAS